MAEFYADDNGNRVLVRHTGPAGRGIPAGGTVGQILVRDAGGNYSTHWANPPNGTDAVNGPVSALDGNVAVFDGTTGKLIKDSTRSLSYFATASLVATKQDKVTGKGLSTNDFTTPLLDKLIGLSTGGFRGIFGSMLEIEGYSFSPAPLPGDYCYIESSGVDVIIVLWDDTNDEWIPQNLAAITPSGGDIATALFKTVDASSYDKDTCRIYTTEEKSKLELLSDLFTGTTSVVFGAVTTVTDASMVGLGVTKQLQIVVGETNYWVPLKAGAPWT